MRECWVSTQRGVLRVLCVSPRPPRQSVVGAVALPLAGLPRLDV